MIGLLTEENSVYERIVVFKNKWITSKKVIIIPTIALITLLCFLTDFVGYVKIIFQSTNKSSICPLIETITPSSYTNDNNTVLEILYGEKFRLNSVSKLSKAVQVDTQVYDDWPDVPDAPEKWAKFKKFHDYLEDTFPRIYKNLDLEYVNTYGLVFSLKGKNPNLKPLMLTAHQDTVPVQRSTLRNWTYPPFEGHYDGKYIYGRGSLDTKNVLVAIMEAVDLLIEKNYTPERGLIIAFGFDEEISGFRGAKSISNFLLEKLGKDSIYAILDEGAGLTLEETTQQIVAIPAVGEKGYLDIQVDLTTRGGHSSIPPDHTSIGIMAELAYLIEKDPYEPILSSQNPVLKFLQCLAVNSGDKLPLLARKTILRAGFDNLANSKIIKKLLQNPLSAVLIKTSQAIDIIKGGEKANALPESTRLVVNHRIAVETTVDEIIEHFTSRVLEVGKKYGISVKSFELIIYEGDNGIFVLSNAVRGLDSAPISPSNDTVWKYLSGTIRHVFEDIVFSNVTYPIITAPAIMPANTDTRYYWGLTKNIYRFSPFFVQDPMSENRIHTVDERMGIDGHLQLVAFFYEYIQNIDTSDADNKA